MRVCVRVCVRVCACMCVVCVVRTEQCVWTEKYAAWCVDGVHVRVW